MDTTDKMLSTRVTIIACLAAAWCWTSNGQVYDVACPGVNLELKCPEGQVIEILTVEHGPQTGASCDDRTNPGEVAEDNCLNPLLLPWMKFVCDDLNRCRLPKPFESMYFCDYKNDFNLTDFIQTTYVCKDKSPDVHTTIACEGQEAKLKCEAGAIQIVKANYGRLDENTCTDTPSAMTYCVGLPAAYAVRHRCNGESECSLTATSEVLGRTMYCDSLPKYLLVDYVCQ